jgi:hypothetical protein
MGDILLPLFYNISSVMGKKFLLKTKLRIWFGNVIMDLIPQIISDPDPRQGCHVRALHLNEYDVHGVHSDLETVISVVSVMS